MKYTSAQAAKLLRRLTEQISSLESSESRSREFLAALGEDVESVRPAYDYAAVQAELDMLEQKVRTVKHALNTFNTTQTVPEFGMTIDQLLIYIPQLTRRRDKLALMKNKLPKTRESAAGFGRNNALIDYRYMNYDIEAVQKDYDAVSETLAAAQIALDCINNTETMDIEL